MTSLLFLLPLFVAVFSEVEVNSDGVLVLTTDTFKQGVESADYVLVEFYAPWCGHCKALAPEYAKAAKILAEKHPDLSVKLAMVDATVESSLGKDYGVRGYPTLKFFKGSDAPKDYEGGRKADEIVNWIVKKTGPAATDLAELEEAKKFADSDEFITVGFFASKDSDAAKAFLEVAQDLDDVKFGISVVADVAKHFEVAQDKVVVFRKFDEPKLVHEGEMSAQSIKEFIGNNRLPYVIEFSDETAPKIFGGSIKTHSLLFCKSEESADLLAEYKKAAMKLKGKVIFIYLDIAKESNSRVMEFFNLKPEDGTQLRVIKMDGEMQKFKAELAELNEATVAGFVSDVLDGKVKRHLMTEEIPEDWDKAPVKVLVGKNFEEVALDTTKDVLVEFYAPWCGHCKALAPIYDELAEHFKDTADVVIAKVDSTKNEVSVVEVQGFPTIVLFTKENKQITFNGDRKLDAMKKFVETRGAEQKEEEEEAEEEEEEGDAEGHDEL